MIDDDFIEMVNGGYGDIIMENGLFTITTFAMEQTSRYFCTKDCV